MHHDKLLLVMDQLLVSAKKNNAGSKPVMLSKDNGGTVISLVRYMVIDTEESCGSWFPADIVSKEAAELGTV